MTHEEMKQALISRCLSEIQESYPLLSLMIYKRDLDYWGETDDLLIETKCTETGWSDRTFIYMLLILESEGV